MMHLNPTLNKPRYDRFTYIHMQITEIRYLPTNMRLAKQKAKYWCYKNIDSSLSSSSFGACFVELQFACLWDQWSISIWWNNWCWCCCTQKNSQVWEMLYVCYRGVSKNLSCHSNCVVWTGAPLRLQCVTLASNRTILPIYTSQKMVHYLEVTTTALLAMLCPLLVTSQEVFQAEVINFFFHFVIIARIVCLWCE